MSGEARWLTEEQLTGRVGSGSIPADVVRVHLPDETFHRFGARWWSSAAAVEEIESARGALQAAIDAAAGRPIPMGDAALDLLLLDDGWEPGGPVPVQKAARRVALAGLSASG